MKKVLALFVLAAGITACNNEGNSSESLKDSALETIDSAADAKVDSIEETTDSVKQRLENTFDKTDSANKALADSADTR